MGRRYGTNLLQTRVSLLYRRLDRTGGEPVTASENDQHHADIDELFGAEGQAPGQVFLNFQARDWPGASGRETLASDEPVKGDLELFGKLHYQVSRDCAPFAVVGNGLRANPERPGQTGAGPEAGSLHHPAEYVIT